MTAPSSWPAPAKVNRFLRIVGRRDDGYHLLQTVFQFLDWHDEIEIESTADGSIECQHQIEGVGKTADLCYRAAEVLRKHATHAADSCGARIRLHKQLPVGAGLGGGSSDAATILVALNELWGLDMATERLAQIGLGLGADVPVFIHGQACWAEGVGEQITTVEPEESWAALLIPPVQVSTGSVFRHPELNRSGAPLRMPPPGELMNVIAKSGNDCLSLVRSLYPQVAEALDFLSNACGEAYLSGTGCSVFAPIRARTKAERFIASAPCEARVVRLLNRSPLMDCVERSAN